MTNHEFRRKLQTGDYESFVLHLAYSAQKHQLTRHQFDLILNNLLETAEGRELFQISTSMIIQNDPAKWDAVYCNSVLNHIAAGDVNEELLRHWAKVCQLKNLTPVQGGILGACIGGISAACVCTAMSIEAAVTAWVCAVAALGAGAIGWFLYRPKM